MSGFRKTARVASLGAAQASADGLLAKTASSDGSTRSYYIDGGSKINVKDLLSRVASAYAISDDPSDYIFEAIRANTTNVPNENHDAFHRSELLSWNTSIGMPVYLTYREKPHHVNHRTENPKTARGVIVDSHYNDDTPPLDNCPACNHRTASAEGRDPSGIHCTKCGSVVKDEFVEILVAIDTVKDPVFANGVRTGQLKAGSMGCNCAKTACKVCSHVARSRAEFCEHIRAGNKGSLWARSASKPQWKRIAAASAAKYFGEQGVRFDTADFCTMRAADGFEVRKAYEECIGVHFDEYSRVDQPADPKALQREILGKSASMNTPSPEELRMESEQLIARTSRRQAAQEPRTAMKYFVVRVDGDEADTYAAESLDEAIELAQPDPGSSLESAEVEATDPGAARLEANTANVWAPLGDHNSHEGDVTINITEPEPGQGDEQVEFTEDPTDMEDFTEEELMPGPEMPLDPSQQQDDEFSTGEMGVLPGASKENDDNERNAMSHKFADAYRGWEVQVTPRGNARLVSPHGPVMLVQASAAPKSDADRRAFGREILNHLANQGLLRTAKRYKAMFDAKFAQVVDHADDDMKEFADKYTKSEVAGGGVTDMAGADRGKMRDDVRDDSDNDQVEKRTVEVQTVIESHDADHEVAEVASDLGVAKEDNSDRREPRKPFSLSKNTTLENAVNDRAAAKKKDECKKCGPAKSCKCEAKEASSNPGSDAIREQWAQLDTPPAVNDDGKRAAALFEQRLKKRFASKVAALRAEADSKVAEARADERKRFAQALRIIAKRHQLNRELSPLKEAMGVVLTNPRTVGHDGITGRALDWQPIGQELAVHLVEAAYKDAGDTNVTTLIDRAAELMDKDAGYLNAEETELSKQAHLIPPVTAASMVNDVDRQAEELRHQVTAGNMQLTSNDVPAAAPYAAAEHRTSIRAAVSGSKNIVNEALNQFRP